jgi:hypothetical protein
MHSFSSEQPGGFLLDSLGCCPHNPLFADICILSTLRHCSICGGEISGTAIAECAMGLA